MTEYEKAKAWRLALKLTPQELGDKLGYSRESIYSFERGVMPRGNGDRRIKPWVWRRYRLACRGFAADLIDSDWDWDMEERG